MSANTGTAVAAEVRYIVKLVNGPWKFSVRGAEFELSDCRDDILVLARVTESGGIIVDEKIVGVIGGADRFSPGETLRIVKFMNGGGVIGLDRELVRK